MQQVMTVASIKFDYVPAEDVPAAVAIEREVFPLDEAESIERFRLRHSGAPKLFLGAYCVEGSVRRLIGFVCASQSPDAVYTQESMVKHVADAPYVCIHSVCVSNTYQGKGLGKALLKEYFARLEAANLDGSGKYKGMQLIAHDNLIPFYEKAGFEYAGKSDVVHGLKPWIEMRRKLHILRVAHSRHQPSMDPAENRLLSIPGQSRKMTVAC